MTLPCAPEQQRRASAQEGLQRSAEEWDGKEHAIRPEPFTVPQRIQLCECWYCRNGGSWQVRIGGWR